uniref:SAP domain-containing protein n=1 Tax=Cebus imitator TaxID=2715852 RepID=A0A2K5S5G7_CEBIM
LHLKEVFLALISCIQSVYISKIISSDRDLLAVVFYGTEKDKNAVNFKNIYVLQELDNPGRDQFKGQQGQKRFQELMGHGSMLWVCANLFSDKPGGFDISLFYRDIISIAEDEDLRVHFEESSKLEDLLRKVRAKEARKRALSRLKLKLNKDIVISVGIYNLVQKALKPPPIKLYRETNEPVKTKTWTFNTSTGGLLLPSDTKRSQIYGSRQIILEKEETEELKRFDDPGLMLMGFKPLVMLKKHHYLRPSLFVYPEESLVIGSSTLFSALLIKCLEKEVEALCRYTPRRNIPPYFVALVPQDEELDDQKIQVTPPGFQLVFLPFADDKRKMPFTEKIMATSEQVDKMKAIVEKLCFTYRSDTVDLTLPKVEELVYPPDYNPEGKVTKRKHDNEGSGSKRPKVEYSEEKLKTHISKGTLGKLTVPMLKEACRAYGLKSGLKKQELLEALIKHFQD